MRREQFYSKYNHLGVDQRELERKYQAYLREQEEMARMHMQYVQAMNEAAQSSSSAGTATAGGGGGQILPVAQVEIGQSEFTIFIDDADGHYKVLTANATTGEISNVVDLGIDSADYNYDYNEITSGRGIMFVGQKDEDNSLWFAFIDPAGNLMGIEKDVVTHADSWNSRSNSGLSIMMAYRITLGQGNDYYRVHSFFGGAVYVTDFPIGNSDQDYPYAYWANYPNLADGTFDVYWYDDAEDLNRHFLIKPDGTYTELTGLDENGAYYDNNAWLLLGGDTVVGTYNNDDTGNPAFIRVWDKNGKRQEFDVSVYEPTSWSNTDSYGRNKWMCMLDCTTNWVLVVYDGDTRYFQAEVFDKATYPDYGWANVDDFRTFQNYTNGSVEGLDVLALWFYEQNGADSHMSLYSAFQFVWKNGTQGIQKHVVNMEEGDFGFVWDGSDLADKYTTFCHRGGSSNLEIVTLCDDGALFTTMPSSYADTGDYFDVAPSREMAFLTYYDNSREGDIQYFGAWDTRNQVFYGDPQWITNDNGWFAYNGNLIINYTGAGDTIFWDYWGIKDWFTYGSEWLDTWYADYNGSGGDYITGNNLPSMYRHGTVLFSFDNGDVLMMSEAHGLQASSGGHPISYDEFYLTKDYIYYTWQDGNWYITVYDTAWNEVVEVDLGFSNWGVVNHLNIFNKRCILRTVDGSLGSIKMVTPSGLVETSYENYTNFTYVVNDWRWWD